MLSSVSGFMVGTRLIPCVWSMASLYPDAQVRGGDDEPMWIYGEMAGVLCQEGNHAAA